MILKTPCNKDTAKTWEELLNHQKCQPRLCKTITANTCRQICVVFVFVLVETKNQDGKESVTKAAKSQIFKQFQRWRMRVLAGPIGMRRRNLAE